MKQSDKDFVSAITKFRTDESVDLGEAYYDQRTADDMNAIAHMLEASEKEGLQCEVVYQLLQGHIENIPRACAGALYEWDI